MKAQILTVVPLSRSLPQDHLSYFSTKKVELGDIVSIPIRKQIYKGIVIHITDAKNQKAQLKDSKYGLRAIKDVVGPSPFSQEYFQSAKAMQQYFLGSLSQIVTDMLPTPLVKEVENLTQTQNQKEKENPAIKEEHSIFQNPFSERVAFYKSYVREAFARGESVRICVPTIKHAESLGEELARGIKDYCFVFHSKKTQKTLARQFNQCVESEHPLCLIHTPRFLCIPRHDTKTLVIEYESSPHYRSLKKPFVDGRIFAEYFGVISGHKIIYADTLLRTETLARNTSGELSVVNKLQFRIESNAHHKVIDMRAGDTPNTLLSNTVLQEVLNYYRSGKKIVLFSLRPSLATTTICGDCGTTLTHEGSPLTLHKDPKTGERYFKSKKHGETFGANTVCKNCQSWNLVPLGVGTERIEEYLHEIDHNMSVVRIDQNQNHTPKQTKEILEAFYSSEKGEILVTSLVGIQHMKTPVDLTCVVSLDTLFNIPQFNMYEQIMHIVMDLSLITQEKLYIQTRHTDQNIISILQNKRLRDFFEYDYKERKSWEYPPFSTIIKMIYDGPRSEASSVQRYLEKQFGMHELHIYHTKGSQPENLTTHAVLKISNNLWPLPKKNMTETETTAELRRKLAIFPQSWTIIVNPHNIL